MARFISLQLRQKLLRIFPKNIFKLQRSSTNWSYYHNPGTEPLQYLTIGQVANLAANRYGDDLAVISEHQNISMTFGEIIQQANQLAAGLLELGLQPGDKLGLCSSNNVMWCVTAIAAAKVGLILVTLNPAYVGHELEYCLRKVGVRAIIAEETFKTQKYYNMLCEMMPEMEDLSPATSVSSRAMPDLKFVIINSASNLPGSFRFDDIVQGSGSMKALHEAENRVTADHASCVVFTSGTTGHPKGVLQSHFNIVNNSMSIGKRIGYHEQKHKILIQNPFFHVFGLVIGIVNILQFGNTLVLPAGSFKAKDSLKALRKHQCTVLYGTPTMYVDLRDAVRQLSSEEQQSVKSPQIIVCGSALCSPDLFRDMIDCFDCNRIFSVYGQTECTAVNFQSTNQDTEDLITSTVGKLGDHLEMKLIDANGNTVPMGIPGELCIRGYSLMREYYDEKGKTKECFTEDRWYKTGDLFVLLENGYGQIVGRIKDMIIRGGENISPKEIENFLERHPRIKQAQVYGVKDERMGEEVGCSIELKDNQTLNEQEVKDYCKGNIAHYKIPKYVEFVTDFPKTASGKIQKYKLKQMMEEKLSTVTKEKASVSI